MYTYYLYLYCSIQSNVIDLNAMPMTLLNATNFIMRHQKYLLQGDEDAAQISDNEGTAKIL